MEIHVLSRQGRSIKAIAREFGLSRNTVRRYLRQPACLPQYPERAPRPTKLDPFQGYLQERVEAARPHWIPATVLLRELQERGYDGGIRQLKAYLQPFKPTVEDPVVRFETPAGRQLQVDFTTIRRGNPPLKAFVATLGYSRATYVRFGEREDSEAWLTGIREACVFFGGVPQDLLFYNARAIILERDAYGDGQHRWHPAPLDLATTFGFRPRVCRPYRARTKGKVERFNRYLKESFVTPLAATPAWCSTPPPPMPTSASGCTRSPTSACTAPPSRSPPSWAEQIHAFLPLPTLAVVAPPTPRRPCGTALPIESLQHPLSVYDQLLGVA